VNPCCCTPGEECERNECHENPENPCPPIYEWYAEALYNEIAAAFLNDLHIDMGSVNFRLAIVFQPFAWGCWDDDETGTCCAEYNCPTCGGGNANTMRVDCWSAYNVSEVNDPQWRAYQYAPNQFLTACGLCDGGGCGYLTYGLPTRDQYYPRCNDCASRTPDGCVFTAWKMPDLLMIDDNTELSYWDGNPPDYQPEDSGGHCCQVVPDWDCDPFGGGTFPYRETLHFSTSTPGSFLGGYILQQYEGSPTSCMEPATARDVYVRKELWVLPNLGGAGNCIRIVAKISYRHTFQATKPDIWCAGSPLPCTCAEVGRAWVGPQGTTDRQEQSWAWYYVDIRATDTFDMVKKMGMRLFRLEHTEELEALRCGAEEGAIVLNNFTGCDAITNPATGECGCADSASPTGQCSDTGPFATLPIPYDDCPDWPSGTSEVYCTPRTTQLFPYPPPNTHFDFPHYIFVTT